MEKIGVIDIGSNSIRLIIAKIKNDDKFKIIDDHKEIVKLGKGMETSPYLRTDRIDKGLTTLIKFKEICDKHNIEKIVAFATAAVRKAHNRYNFIYRVKEKTNIDITILSGQDEAYYDYLAVINSMDIDNGLIIDIGGGSIELGLITNKILKDSVSLPFGYLDLSDQFEIENNISEQEEIMLANSLEYNFSNVNWLNKITTKNLIGVGGSMKNMAKIDRKLKKSSLKIHNYKLNKQEVNNIYTLVKGRNIKQRKNIKGLSKRRARYFIGVSAIVKTIINYCNLQTLITSKNGVREGAIYNYLITERKKTVTEAII